MKWILRILAALAVLAAGGAVAVWALFDANQFRPRLEAELSRALGRGVAIGDLKLALASGSVTAANLIVSDDPAFRKDPFVRAGAVHIGVEMKPLIFERKLIVTAVSIDQPEIVLAQTAAGDWNFSSLGGKPSASPEPAQTAPAPKGGLDLSVKLIRVGQGRVTLIRPASKTQVFSEVNVEVRDFSPAAAFPFDIALKAGDASAKLTGKAGPIDTANTAMTPVAARVSITNLDLARSGLLERSKGISGIVSVNATGTSDGRKIQTQGSIHAAGLKLARDGTPSKRPVQFDFTINHDVGKRYGAITAGTIHIGKAAASIAGSYMLRTDPVSISMRVNGPQMAIAELIQMMPPLGLVLPSGSSLEGGHAAAELLFEGPVDRLSVSGPLGLFDTRLAGFDLGSRIQKIAAAAGIPVGPNTDIQQLSAKVRATPEGTSVEELVLNAPLIGELTGSGNIGPQHELDFTMRVKLHTSGALMNALGQKGDTVIPFFVRGTSSAPVFTADVKTVAKERAAAIVKSETVKGIIQSENPLKEAKGVLEGIFGKKKKAAPQP